MVEKLGVELATRERVGPHELAEAPVTRRIADRVYCADVQTSGGSTQKDMLVQ